MPTSGDVLLDTSIIVDHLRARIDLTEHLQQAERVLLPLPALGELLFGARRSRNPEHAVNQVLQFVQATVVLLPDEKTADHYSILKSRLLEQGTPIPENDIWIAALAQQHDLPLATRDMHFAHVSDLVIVVW